MIKINTILYVYKKFSLYLCRINLHLKLFIMKTVQKQYKNSTKTVQKQVITF